MKDYLYKAKCINTGKWITGSLLIDNYPHPLIDPESPPCFVSDPEWNCSIHTKPIFHEVIPETVCKFTGIMINDKQLFDRDIFVIKTTLETVKVVKYIPERMAFCIANKEDLDNVNTVKVLGSSLYVNPSEQWWKEFGKLSQIIGNIYD